MGTWKIDPDHSVVFFAVKHFMITDVRGQINQVTGRVVFDEEALLSTTIDLEIGAGAIFTGVGKRDEHLRSSDFLDAAKYPTIQFQGRAVELTAVRSFKMKGNLTLRGITRGMILDVDCVGPVRVPEELGGETCMSFVLSGRLRQEDFGIIWNVPMENNGLLVGREIRLWVNLEADLETPVEQT
jgi:polyisoprenoid-binding protein YceI